MTLKRYLLDIDGFGKVFVEIPKRKGNGIVMIRLSKREKMLHMCISHIQQLGEIAEKRRIFFKRVMIQGLLQCIFTESETGVSQIFLSNKAGKIHLRQGVIFISDIQGKTMKQKFAAVGTGISFVMNVWGENDHIHREIEVV